MTALESLQKLLTIGESREIIFLNGGKSPELYFHPSDGEPFVNIGKAVASVLGRKMKKEGVTLDGWSTKHYEAATKSLSAALGIQLQTRYACALVASVPVDFPELDAYLAGRIV
jgi:hypothetical protein